MKEEDLKRILAPIENVTDRRVRFLGLFSEAYHRETGRWPILVGGCAVEIYTQGGRATGDMDLLCDRSVAAGILRGWGFEQSTPGSRDIIHRDLDLYVETVGQGDVNEDREATERVVFMTTGEDRLRLALIALEDLILDRLSAAKHWESQDDRMWSAILIDLGRIHYHLDLDYLRRKAAEPQKDCLDLLEELLRDPDKDDLQEGC